MWTKKAAFFGVFHQQHLNIYQNKNLGGLLGRVFRNHLVNQLVPNAPLITTWEIAVIGKPKTPGSKA